MHVPWRALMLAAVSVGSAFLLGSFVEVVLLWVCFIAKLLRNLLLMSYTQKFGIWIGQVSFRGEEGGGPNYQKICNTNKYNRQIGWDVSCWTTISNIGLAILLEGPSLPPRRVLYFGLRQATFKKWYSLNQPIFFVMKWLPMILIVSCLRPSGEQGWRKGQAVSNILLHFFPLKQNRMQTFWGNSWGKILLILIFGLSSQNMPMSNWVSFTVPLVTAWHCFFLVFDWGWLCSTFRGRGVMLISCRSVGHLVTMRIVSGFALVVSFGSQIVGSGECIRKGVVTGVSLVPRIQNVGFDGRYHGHNGFFKGMVQDDVILKCWMLSSEIGQFSAAMFTY